MSETLYTVTISNSPSLGPALTVLGIPWRIVDNTTLAADLDDAADGRLEALIDALADLRWHYTPGRTLQFALPCFESINGGTNGAV